MTRVDAWLWSVRLFKTRTAATDACRTGRVSIDDEPVKPARRLEVGETVTVRRGPAHLTIVRVEQLISKRVGAKVAVDCYEDLSPPPPPRDPHDLGIELPPSGTRERGAGRPTKRERRETDRLRNRDGS